MGAGKVWQNRLKRGMFNSGAGIRLPMPVGHERGAVASIATDAAKWRHSVAPMPFGDRQEQLS
jgi:hypothetical protein